MSGRTHELVVFGATGYTGRLVCEHLAESSRTGEPVGWAIAGRDRSRLEALHGELGLDSDVGICVADTTDQDSLEALASQSRVLLSTVGPYQLYGSGVVEACARQGTHYADLCGEATWIKEMIERHQSTAVDSGARIVFSCGFDAVPSDLGVFLIQSVATEEHGAPLDRVKMRIRSLRGSGSGGTLATLRATMKAVGEDPELAAVMLDPFALADGFRGPPQPSGMERIEEEEFGGWSGPFMMATINTKIVHRTNELLGHPYGTDFVYDEMILLGPNPSEESGDMFADPGLQPGEGPSREEREAGHYELLFQGVTDHGETLRVSAQADLDPGYGSTSKILAETGRCLLETEGPGGLTTPAAAMGATLIERLQTHAGVSFSVDGKTFTRREVGT